MLNNRIKGQSCLLLELGMGEQLKVGNMEKGETLWKRRDILRGKKEGEKMKRENY